MLTTQALPVTDPSFTNGTLWGIYGDGSTPANPFGSRAAEAWAAGHSGSKSVYVGVIDEGIQFDHPDLAGQVWTNTATRSNGVDDDKDGYVDDVHGWDFANKDGIDLRRRQRGSLDAHGTHVSGTIGGRGATARAWSASTTTSRSSARSSSAGAAARCRTPCRPSTT